MHPTERALAEFVAGDLGAEETRRVVRHLLSGCAECRRFTRRLWPPRAPERTISDHHFDLCSSLLRERDAAIAEQRRSAARLFGALEALPQSRRMLLAANSRRYRTWFLVERIVDRVIELWFQEPAGARDWARVAVTLADRLPAQRIGEALVNDIRARAWAALGNTLRIASDHGGAGEAFAKAAALLEEGTGDPLEEIRVLSWRALYLRNRRENRAALRLLDRAIGLCRRIGDLHWMGTLMVDKGTLLSHAGNLEQAIRTTTEALDYLDGARDPRTLLAAKHNLSLYLNLGGEVERSMALLQEILPLYAEQNEPMVLLRLRWLEGRLAQAQQEFRRAEEAFREVQRGFRQHEVPYEAAAVSFDLATVLLEEGRWEELGRLAAEVLSICNSLGMPTETVAALELFQRAIDGQRLSAEWIAELAAYVKRARVQPEAPFEPGL